MVVNNERLKNKYEKALNALKTLQEAQKDIMDAGEIARCAHKKPEVVYRTYRDSLVQRFEYTFDTTWKYVSEYLEAEGRVPEVKTPKAIFREGLKLAILSEDETRLALKMVDHRNVTTHGYDEELVEEIVKNIPDYIVLFEHLLQRTRGANS